MGFIRRTSASFTMAVRGEFWNRNWLRSLPSSAWNCRFRRTSPLSRRANTLLATTPHSYKGYESEVVIIPCVDLYVAPEGKLVANGLYVAMTRARSLLAIYGINGGSEASKRVTGSIAACVATRTLSQRSTFQMADCKDCETTAGIQLFL